MDLTNFIKDLERKAEERNGEKPGDYRDEDGLLCCGKCHTRKQTRIMLLGEEMTPFCLCKCESEKKAKEEEEFRKAQFADYVKHLRDDGFPDKGMHDWTFANTDGSNEKLMSAAQRYVDNFKELSKSGKGLLLYGDVGSGKTYISACIANALIDKGYPVLMTNFAKIANTVSGMWEGKQEYYDGLNDYRLLVIDDLAAERKTEYMSEIIFNVIDSRYRANLPMIVTTNLTSEELKNPIDMSYQRTFSRLLEMCTPIKVEGEDKRAKKMRAGMQDMRKLLGL